MAGSRQDNDEAIAEINVVPLVDIILGVLIIFMVTAPLVLKPSIDVNLPQASSGSKGKNKKKRVEVVVGSAGELFLEGQAISLDDLKAEAKAKAEESPDTSIVLTADKNITLDGLTNVIDAIKTSGIKKVGFSIQKK